MTNIAVLGFGVVGGGIACVLDENRERIEALAGGPVNLKYILDLRDFPDSPYGDRVVHDIDRIIEDESISIVCEAMGGVHPALEFSLAALNAGKSVVTSNKELVAKHGVELLEAAEKNGIHAYSSLKALLSDPAVDFVTIAVPNDMHKPLAIEAMKAGKHVISEKPVTLSSADLQEMFDASDKYHRLFTVHQNRRWDGEFLLMRDIYHSGDLGQVYRMESRVHGSRGIPGDWRGTPEHGGGMILDWGIHLIDQIMGIVDDKTLRKVFCHCDHITNELVDDGFQLDMFFDDDLVARVEVGTSNFISMPRFYMTGADGSAIIPDWCQPAHVVWCHNYNEKDVVPVKTAAGITKTMAPRRKIHCVQGYSPARFGCARFLPQLCPCHLRRGGADRDAPPDDGGYEDHGGGV